MARAGRALRSSWPPLQPASRSAPSALCTPSLGTKFSKSDTASGSCGRDGSHARSTTLSAGDALRTRYALNNSSTGSVRVTSALYLSTDETWDEGDLHSTSPDRTDDLGEATSSLVKATWNVPALRRGTAYHPIIRVISEHVDAHGRADATSVTPDWIPLRGVVCGAPGCPISAMR